MANDTLARLFGAGGKGAAAAPPAAQARRRLGPLTWKDVGRQRPRAAAASRGGRKRATGGILSGSRAVGRGDRTLCRRSAYHSSIRLSAGLISTSSTRGGETLFVEEGPPPKCSRCRGRWTDSSRSGAAGYEPARRSASSRPGTAARLGRDNKDKVNAGWPTGGEAGREVAPLLHSGTRTAQAWCRAWQSHAELDSAAKTTSIAEGTSTYDLFSRAFIRAAGVVSRGAPRPPPRSRRISKRCGETCETRPHSSAACRGCSRSLRAAREGGGGFATKEDFPWAVGVGKDVYG